MLNVTEDAPPRMICVSSAEVGLRRPESLGDDGGDFETGRRHEEDR